MQEPREAGPAQRTCGGVLEAQDACDDEQRGHTPEHKVGTYPVEGHDDQPVGDRATAAEASSNNGFSTGSHSQPSGLTHAWNGIPACRHGKGTHAGDAATARNAAVRSTRSSSTAKLTQCPAEPRSRCLAILEPPSLVLLGPLRSRSLQGQRLWIGTWLAGCLETLLGLGIAVRGQCDVCLVFLWGHAFVLLGLGTRNGHQNLRRGCLRRFSWCCAEKIILTVGNSWWLLMRRES